MEFMIEFNERMAFIYHEICKELCPYNPTYCNILLWRDKFEYFVDIFDVPNDQVLQLFISMLSRSASLAVQELCSESQLITYPYLISLLEDKFSTIHGIDAVRFRFDYRSQFPNETMEHYAMALKFLALGCNLGEDKESILKTTFIKGIFKYSVKVAVREQAEKLNLEETIACAIKCEIDMNKDESESKD